MYYFGTYVFGILKIIFNTLSWKNNTLTMALNINEIFLKRRLNEAVNLLIISVILLINVGSLLISYSPIPSFYALLQYEVHTIMSFWNWTIPDLWSKMLIFKRVFDKLILLLHFCTSQNFWPLMRAFKWGTKWGFSSRGIRMAKGQSSRLLTLLNKKWVFQNF